MRMRGYKQVKHIKHVGYFQVTCRLLQFTSHQLTHSYMSNGIQVFHYILVHDTPNITPFLGKHFLLILRYSYIHTYLNYANLSQAIANKTNLKKSLSQQKHTIRIVNNKTRLEHTKEVFNSQKILNIYKLNIINIAIFMHKVYNETARATFLELFQKFSYPYPTGFSKL